MGEGDAGRSQHSTKMGQPDGTSFLPSHASQSQEIGRSAGLGSFLDLRLQPPPTPPPPLPRGSRDKTDVAPTATPMIGNIQGNEGIKTIEFLPVPSSGGRIRRLIWVGKRRKIRSTFTVLGLAESYGYRSSACLRRAVDHDLRTRSARMGQWEHPLSSRIADTTHACSACLLGDRLAGRTQEPAAKTLGSMRQKHARTVS
jgi:hypothetical protein